MFKDIFILIFGIFISLSSFGQTYIKAPALIEGVSTTVTIVGTTTLSSASQTVQIFTGSSAHTVKLPDVTTIPIGRYFYIANRSSQTLTVNDSSNALVTSILSGTQKYFIRNTLAAWDVSAININDVAGVLPIINGGTGLSSTPSSGQLLIGNGTGYSLAGVTATANQTTVTNGSGSITIGTVQNIGTGSSPTFSGLTLSSLGLGIVHSSSGGLLSSSLVNLTSDVTGTLPVGNGGTGLATTPTNGQLLIGNGTNYSLANLTGTANRVTVTNGSGTITLSGPQDISTSSSPTFSGLTLSSLSTGVLHSNGSGVISSASVNLASEVSGVLPISNGGTGQSSKSAAFDALSPMTTGGDIIYGGASGTATRLANGSSGQYLTSSGGTSAPTWTTGLSNPLTTTGDIIYGVGSTPTRLAAGTSGNILQTLGNTLAPVWTALSSIAGSVTSNAQNALREEYVTLNLSGASTVSVRSASSNWYTNFTASGTTVTGTWSGVWSAEPACNVTCNTSSSQVYGVFTSNPSTTGVGFACYNDSAVVQTSSYIALRCIGPR